MSTKDLCARNRSRDYRWNLRQKYAEVLICDPPVSLEAPLMIRVIRDGAIFPPAGCATPGGQSLDSVGQNVSSG